jgi:hypothetical protein
MLNNITHKIEEVTPEMAKDFLENNKDNRRLKESAVAQYATDMREGRWSFTGQPIIFSNKGRLLNGQHTLNALIQANVTLPFLIVRGIEDKNFDAMDIGKTRTVGDILSILGQKNGNDFAGVARIAMRYFEGVNISGSGRRVYSQKEVADYITENPYLIDLTTQVKASRGMLPLTALASVLFIGNQTRQFDKDIIRFLSALKTGEGLTKGNPILALREWIMAERLKHYTLSVDLLFPVVAKVWTTYMESKTLSVIKPKNILGRPVEIFGFTNHAEASSVAARTRPSREAPSPALGAL